MLAETLNRTLTSGNRGLSTLGMNQCSLQPGKYISQAIVPSVHLRLNISVRLDYVSLTMSLIKKTYAYHELDWRPIGISLRARSFGVCTYVSAKSDWWAIKHRNGFH